MGYWDTHPIIENTSILKVPTFKPSFRQAAVTDGVNYWPLNSDYFADFPTAQWIATKYGDGNVFESPFPGSGGPFAATANVYLFRLHDGRMTNAGIIAAYYLRNPEDQFPSVADKLIKSTLGLG